MADRIESPVEFRAALDAARARGERVGLVPTMGALHAGHLRLIEEARLHGATFVVVTIFVNPLQFAPGEDFERYPRTVDEDHARAAAAGADLVFVPTRSAMYRPGFATRVEVDGVTAALEGAFRPGHFAGVTTVVAKLFGLAGPCVAVFGRKDYQQLRAITRMAADLDLPVEIVGARIVREADGLALSSRNRYLSAEERGRALAIVEGLRAASDAWAGGERNAHVLLTCARAPIEARFDRIDYVALADPDSVAPLDAERPPLDSSGDAAPGPRVLLAVAAHLGSTRLIDNVVLGEDPRP